MFVSGGMEKHYRLTDDQFESKFADKTFPPMHFTHEAHLRLAWVHINKYGAQQAIENLCLQIKEYALKYGATMKYNETVTVASVRILDHYIRRYQGDDFQDFITRWSALKTDFKSLVKQHYSTDIFRSVEAKQTYLEPDLQGFE